MNNKIPLIAIVGPTASGKTKFSIELAKMLNAEIINADSMQIYCGMDIGTAKITQPEMQNVPHHLIDIVNPTENFCAMDYVKLAHNTIKEIHLREKLPMLVGGTGLYIDLVVNNTQLIEGQKNLELREELNRLESNHLFEMLEQLDPEEAKIIDRFNNRRLIRALELNINTGLPNSKIREMSKGEQIYNSILFGINIPREQLYQNINDRVISMLENGLIEEVRTLKQLGLNPKNTAYHGICYKEVFAYLDNQISYEYMIDLIQKNTRHYAKRQLTWFRRNKNINWIDSNLIHYKYNNHITRYL